MTVSIVADGAGERLVFVPKVIRHDARSDASRLNEQGRGSFNRVGIAPRVSTLPTVKSVYSEPITSGFFKKGLIRFLKSLDRPNQPMFQRTNNSVLNYQSLK